MIDPTSKLEDLLKQLQEKMDSLPKKASDNDLSNFFEKLIKYRNGDCIDEEDPCQEMKSPCCLDKLDQVFGSLPVQVLCVKCGKSYLLRELVSK